MGHIEAAIYLLAALFLVLMALAAFYVVAKDLSRLVSEGFTIGLIYMALNDLLIVLILAELIQTIVVFIQRHELDLRLIIAAGITALIRRVLLFGVEKIAWEEMTAIALLILVLVIAIYLIGLAGSEKVRLKE